MSLPIGRHLNWSEVEDSTDLRGDDRLQASHGSGPSVEWELESGGIPMEGLVVMVGGRVTTTGLTPNVKKTFNKKVTDVRPYFKIEGQSINDNGGDTHPVIWKAKVTDNVEGNFADNEFFITTASGKGYGSTESGNTDNLYDFVQNETATAIA